MTIKLIYQVIILTVLQLSAVSAKNASNTYPPQHSKPITTKSGLMYSILKRSDGAKVKAGKEVAFHWTGYFENGKSFGSSKGREPFYFVTGKGQVIKGAEEGLALMQVGDRFLFTMPPALAYGEKGNSSIPPNSTLTFDYQVISVTNPKLSIQKTLFNSINENGINQAIKLYHQLKNQQFEKYSFRENQLNNLGYQLLAKEKLPEAIRVFQLNIQEYPQSWNALDSLGEAYLKSGDYKNSLKYYQMSVQLNPDNTAGINQIKALQARLK